MKSSADPSSNAPPRRAGLAALACAAVLAAASMIPGSAAQAHAMLRRAAPLVGGTTAMPPSEVSLEFTESLEPRFSSIEVQDSAGKRVETGPTQSGVNDPKKLVAKLPALPPGDYKVIWRATSVDTHRTEGSYSFSIKP